MNDNVHNRALRAERPGLPPEEVIRMWLNPQTDDEQNTVAYMVTTMRRQLPTLATMLSREFRQAILAAGYTARHECLDALTALVDEIEGRP